MDDQHDKPWSLKIRSKQNGAPSSAAAALTLAALPGLHLVATGTTLGVVAVHLLRVSITLKLGSHNGSSQIKIYVAAEVS